MTKLSLSMAVGDYEHVRDLTSGRTLAQGIDLNCLHFPVEEIFGRFIAHREWDISEFSLGKFTAMTGAGDTTLVGLPVFPSRVFRHSSIYVRADSPLHACEDLSGRRIGMPEWAQTASIYTRGILHHHHGVKLSEVSWVQAGVNQPGRREKVDVHPPDAVSLDRIADRSLNEMLIAGDIDAVLSARPPLGFTDGTRSVRRLLSNPRAAEQKFYRETGIFPIMHLLVMQRDVHTLNPWAARSVMDACEVAKNASLRRLADGTASHLPLPWTDVHTAEALDLFGADPWPYGLENNRHTLEVFLLYAHEQGITPTQLAPDDLFLPSTLTSIRV